MPRQIIERFLEDAVNVNGTVLAQFPAEARFLQIDVDSGLALEYRKVPADGFFQTGVVENRGMQRLGQTAGLFERFLRGIANLVQIFRKGGRQTVPRARISMVPMAVRSCPNSSCSSREMERNISSCMVISRRGEGAALFDK